MDIDHSDSYGINGQKSVNPTLSLTSFLFGNIDESGQLEGDVFDEECKEHLASLSRLGLGSLIRQVTIDQEDDDDEEDDNEIDEFDELPKSPSAVDYSDINEYVEDDQLAQINDEEDYDAPTETRTPDSLLMPPPDESSSLENRHTEKSEGLPPPTKLNTPLAAMLPPKYAHVDVREIFPDFRPGEVLRFSKLFGAGKLCHLPKRWKHVKKRKRKRNSQSKSEEERKQDQWLYDRNESVDKFALKFGLTPPPEKWIDDEPKFSQPLSLDMKEESDASDTKKRNKETGWRYGPAQLWYDMLDVSDSCTFNYGFKVKEENEAGLNIKEENRKVPKALPPFMQDIDKSKDYPDEAFHMVTQYNWEDDIIWNGDDPKYKVNQKRKNMSAGWVPSSYSRTAQALSLPGKSTTNVTNVQAMKKKYQRQNKQTQNFEVDDTWYSIFPVENEELIYDRWEDDIIWDPDNVSHIPDPKVLTLDPNDENIILGIPEDIDPSTLMQGIDVPPVKVKIPHPHVKKSKLLLGKAGVITTIEEESPPPSPKNDNKDPYNLSNDEFYQAKSSEQTIKMVLGAGLIQHSTSVVELRPPFVPTFMGEKKLRQFHRPTLKHFSHGELSQKGSHPVNPLTKEIKRKAKLREQERLASGGGDVFFMRSPEDLTGKDGEMILVETCEEYPPVLSLVGMCTRVKNYYKRNIIGDKGPPEYKYGETAFAVTSPFLGHMHPGQSIQTIENNMYRAPIYEHKVTNTDFLVIRTRNGYFVREFDSMFVCGQLCPLYEVPGPNSKRANNFIRDFLQVFIYRLFWKSTDVPKRIRMDDIKRGFPSHSESSIRKRLKPCADFKRTGSDSNWWVLKSEFRLPTEEEIRAMVSPEQCAAFFSMLAAEQRLKDNGYGDKFLSVLEDDNEEETQKLDDEIKVAPWLTTRAYIQAVKGKCLLQLSGPADPTGCGEGFSYIRIPNKPTQNKEEQEMQPKRIVTGTDADLRKLSLAEAKGLLRTYGVPEEEIKKLTRWEVIDVVRTLSNEKAKAGEDTMTKFSRGNRFSIAEHQERYKEECQRIFDLQNRVLASEEVLSTDEGSSEEEENDSDMEEKGKYIENILANKKTSSQMTLEKEEQERKELHRMIMGDTNDTCDEKRRKKEEDDDKQYGYGTSGRLLRVTRTFKDHNGQEYTRVETVRKMAVIDTYVKLRTTKDELFIRNFAGQLDEHQREEIKRERRRLQEQLRRIKRNQERLEKGIVTPPKAKKPKLKPDLKLKCGACSQVGHMRTNKACPMYMTTQMNLYNSEESDQKDQLNPMMGLGGISFPTSPTMKPPVNITPAEPDELNVNVEGTKIKLSSKVMKHADEITKKQRKPKDPNKTSGGSSNKRRRAGTIVHCDYLKKKKSVNRRRIDPVVTLSTILEGIINEMREMTDVQPFLFPVNAKKVPDYYNVVQHPMDLQTIRENLRSKKYQSREEFLCDINQIVENSKLYNGVNSTFTAAGERMLSLCIDRFSEKEDKLMRLEKAINPLLDDDDQVAFDYILDILVNTKMFAMPEAWPFMKPVNKKNVKDYYEVIVEPMYLQQISKKVKNHKYHSRKEFMHDMELILKNCTQYNGQESALTQKAQTLVKFCEDSLAEYGDHIASLEFKIALAQQRALEEEDSLADLGEDSISLHEDSTENRPASSEPAPHTSKSKADSQNDDYYGDISGKPIELPPQLAHRPRKSPGRPPKAVVMSRSQQNTPKNGESNSQTDAERGIQLGPIRGVHGNPFRGRRPRSRPVINKGRPHGDVKEKKSKKDEEKNDKRKVKFNLAATSASGTPPWSPPTTHGSSSITGNSSREILGSTPEMFRSNLMPAVPLPLPGTPAESFMPFQASLVPSMPSSIKIEPQNDFGLPHGFGTHLPHGDESDFIAGEMSPASPQQEEEFSFKPIKISALKPRELESEPKILHPPPPRPISEVLMGVSSPQLSEGEPDSPQLREPGISLPDFRDPLGLETCELENIVENEVVLRSETQAGIRNPRESPGDLMDSGGHRESSKSGEKRKNSTINNDLDLSDSDDEIKKSKSSDIWF